MPILTCPTCGSKLEVVEEDLGHVVQCGSCQQTFTAEDPAERKNDGASRKPYRFKEGADADDDRPSRRRREEDDDDRPSRRRSRDDEDDDRDGDYRPRRSRYRDDYDYERRYQQPPQSGMGVTSMILGIVSLPLVFFCWIVGVPCAIMGIIFGILSLKTAGRGMGIAGIIMSCLSFLLLIAVAVIYVLFLAAAGGPGGGGPGGGGGMGGGGGRF